MSYEIKMPLYLDSERFYSYLFLNKLRTIGNEEVVFDFSETKKIDPNIIPNLLILGKMIKDKTGVKARLYLPDTLSAGYLKNYLNQIKFTELAIKYDLFGYVTSPYGGLQGKEIDRTCKTVYFDGNSSVDEIGMIVGYEIKPFAERYLKNFDRYIKEEGLIDIKNDILEFIYESVKNSLKHGRTASFVSFHSKYKDSTINISISDMGVGFKTSFEKKREVLRRIDSNSPDVTAEEYNDYSRWTPYQLEILQKHQQLTELKSILAGINWEGQSKIYGLSNIVRQVLRYHGWMRIHSNDTQVVLTEESFEQLISSCDGENTEHENSFIKSGMNFPGVHIEIVIPMRRKSDVVL